jgi:hypothetical protein
MRDSITLPAEVYANKTYGGARMSSANLRPGGYAQKKPALSAKCRIRKCSDCTKQTCTCDCHLPIRKPAQHENKSHENNFQNVLDLPLRPAAS